MLSPRRAANLFAAGAAAGAAVLCRFSPQEYSFYPRCPFFALTGHCCPGCGATRAVAELLHGHVTAALHFNTVVTLLLPLAFCYFAVMYFTTVRDNRIHWPVIPGWTWKAVYACTALFGVARFFLQPSL
jgi:hypothetical protein